MNLIDGAIARPHTVIVVVLLAAVFGFIALQRIPVQLKPSLDKPEISITTTYRGAAPMEVEDQITTPIEEEMDSVTGISRITSRSSQGRSAITLEFDWGVDKDVAMIDVINKLNQVPDLPEEADAPVAVSVTSDQEDVVMWIVMETSSFTPNEMYEWGNDVIEPRMRRVPGLSDLLIFGGEEREMQVLLDPDRLAEKNIAIGELIAAIRAENLNVRGGFLDQGKRRFNLRTVGRFESTADVGNIVIARSPHGAVYLREVADVRMGYKKKLSEVRTDGKPTVVFGAKRKTGANVVTLCRAMEGVLAELNANFAAKQEDLSLHVAYTEETYINQSIQLAWQNLGIGGLLASIVLIVFLRSFRLVLVVAVTIPVCMITVFIFAYLLGRSLNIISIAGLAFSSGMVVDNAIVVIENIYRHMAAGRSPMEAARKGTHEVWGAVLISTLTTLAVFLPVMFIAEEAGQLFKDIAIAISLAITLSLTAAVLLIPMMASRLAKAPNPESKTEKLKALVLGAWLGAAIAKVYQKAIGMITGRGIGHVLAKLVVVAGIVALFFASMRLLPSAEYLPSGNRNLILVLAQPLVGSSIEKSVNSIRPLEEAIAADPTTKRFFSVFGDLFNAVGVIVKEEFSGEKQMQGHIGKMFGQTMGLTGFEFLFPLQMSIFRDPGKQLEIDIAGPSLERLEAVAGQMKGQLFATEGVMMARSNYTTGAPEVRVELDRRRAADVGLRVADVADVIESLVAGKIVGRYNDDGDQVDLTLYADSAQIDSIDALPNIILRTPWDERVRLDSIATVSNTSAPTAINHVEKERAVTLTVNLKPDQSLEDSIARIERDVLAPTRLALPSSFTVRLSGTADKLNNTLAALTGGFGLAVLIVYLLMVALFRSWLYPFVILITIPLAASGAFIGVSLANHFSGGLVSFDVMAMLGLIILAGIVVNNAILIVHQANNFRADGQGHTEALRASCASRFRPICMSVITSVLGMTPLAIGTGAGTELYRGLGAVLIGGLVVSTVFTLFLVPALLSLFYDLQRMVGIIKTD
jgi:hydrophobic/amphiphilic exporter-1 (mainly G- bacteria), HAE1 family